MPRPVVDQVTEELYAILKPLAYDDEKYDWPLLSFAQTLVGSLQEVRDLSADGWKMLLDVDSAPYEALPWLGQFVGLTTPSRLSLESLQAHEDRIRNYVRATSGFARGTRSSVIAAAQQHLTGTKAVILMERAGDPYILAVRTYLSETPDPALVEATIRTVKPAGIVLDYAAVAGQLYSEAYQTYATYADAFVTYSNYQEALEDTP